MTRRPLAILAFCPSRAGAPKSDRQFKAHGPSAAWARLHRMDSTDRPICSVPECDRVQHARGWCGMHYSRINRSLPPGTFQRRRTALSRGYVLVRCPDHPLAWPTLGVTYAHRLALYDAIGPGSHECHWCGCVLSWAAGHEAHALCVDHLDFNHANNDPANLVPSCRACNGRRKPHLPLTPFVASCTKSPVAVTYDRSRTPVGGLYSQHDPSPRGASWTDVTAAGQTREASEFGGKDLPSRPPS